MGWKSRIITRSGGMFLLHCSLLVIHDYCWMALVYLIVTIIGYTSCNLTMAGKKSICF